MPGPTPKDPKLRQRRNRETTSASLVDMSPLKQGRLPRLPIRKDEDGKAKSWRSEAKDLWRDLWTSPMAGEYTKADVHRVMLYVDLWDRYWSGPTTALAAEIRLQGVCLGVTPIDRRRLQWEIKRVEPHQKPKPQPPERVADPRSVIRSVS